MPLYVKNTHTSMRSMADHACVLLLSARCMWMLGRRCVTGRIFQGSRPAVVVTPGKRTIGTRSRSIAAVRGAGKRLRPDWACRLSCIGICMNAWPWRPQEEGFIRLAGILSSVPPGFVSSISFPFHTISRETSLQRNRHLHHIHPPRPSLGQLFLALQPRNGSLSLSHR